MAGQYHAKIGAHDIRVIAWTLVDLHGAKAVGYADQAAIELEAKGQDISAEAWRVLQWEIEDVLEGRFERECEVMVH